MQTSLTTHELFVRIHIQDKITKISMNQNKYKCISKYHFTQTLDIRHVVNLGNLLKFFVSWWLVVAGSRHEFLKIGIIHSI